jgi:hypothetical protein
MHAVCGEMRDASERRGAKWAREVHLQPMRVGCCLKMLCLFFALDDDDVEDV